MKTAILLATYGSRYSETDNSATRNAKKIEESTGYPVYIAYIHLAPSIQDALGRMAGDGVERIIVVPLFMFSGSTPDLTVRKEIGLDSESRSGRISVDGKDIDVVFAGTFGDHPRIGSVIGSICERYDVSSTDTAIMLIFHGSKTDGPDSNVLFCEDKASALGFEVLCAYNEFQDPTIEDAVKTLASEGKNILAIPMFVSPGKHTLEDIPPKLQITEGREATVECDGKKVHVTYTELIGMDAGIADIILDRIGEVDSQS